MSEFLNYLGNYIDWYDKRGWRDRKADVSNMQEVLKCLKSLYLAEKEEANRRTNFFAQLEPTPEKIKEQKPDSEGWIKWEGGECPVDGKTLIEYRTIYGAERILTCYAAALYWPYNGFAAQDKIIAYRIIKGEE